MNILMRNILIIVLVFAFGNLFASTDTLSIIGSANSNIDITTTKTNMQVATISATSSSTGSAKKFQVSVTSLYGGLKNINASLKQGVVGNYLKSYSIAFVMTTGSGLTNSGPLNTSTIGTTKTIFYVGTEGAASTGLIGNLNFSITGTPPAQLYSGTYTDTLTFELRNLSTTGNPPITTSLILTAAVINDTITLTITPTASASNLPLTNTQVGLNVGSISIMANCQNGYLLKASSTNAGSLVNINVATPGANDKINYALKFGVVPVTLSNTATTFSTVSNATMYPSSQYLGNLTMDYTGVSSGSRTAGTYQDILTFTLQSQ
jgi:hypothetical protein